MVSSASGILAAQQSSTVVGFVVAVFVFMTSRLLYDAWTKHTKTERLKEALVVDCVATLNKIGGIWEDLREENATPDKDNILESARSLFAGFVLSAPAEEYKELISLLAAGSAREIVHYYDR